MSLLGWLGARLSEPSTYAGLASLLAAAAPVIPAPFNVAIGAGAAAAGAIAMFLKERGSAQ